MGSRLIKYTKVLQCLAFELIFSVDYPNISLWLKTCFYTLIFLLRVSRWYIASIKYKDGYKNCRPLINKVNLFRCLHIHRLRGISLFFIFIEGRKFLDFTNQRIWTSQAVTSSYVNHDKCLPGSRLSFPTVVE